MSTVYVRNIDGEPLMPTTRCGHVRILLKTKQARVVEAKPFTIQLLYDTPNVVQPLYLGIDPGRTNIGLTAITESGEEVISAQVATRNKEIPELMTHRKACRQKHRKNGRRDKRRRRARKAGTVKAPVFERKLPGCEKPVVLHDIQNKEARFNHRTRKEGWLTPTASQLLLTHLNCVKLLAKYVPITDVVIELNKFAFMQLDNPNIKPWEYQKGQLYGFYGDVHEAVSVQQGGKCIFCSNGIAHYHHIIPRHCGGSNTLPNIAGVCDKHHDLIHTDPIWQDKLATKKAGMNKKYGALSVLNQVIKPLADELERMYPGHVYAITGKDTFAYREDHGVRKDHYLDAYCIASVVVGNVVTKREIRPYSIQQFRRHDREACHQEMLNHKYYLDGELVATNRHRAYEQKTIALDEYVAKLREFKTETEVQSILQKLVVPAHPSRMKDMNRNLPGSIFRHNGKCYILRGYSGRHNGKPDCLVDVRGAKHPARQCIFIQNNNGLRIVS